IVQLILFIVDSRCTKHMTGNLKLLCNFMEKFLGTVHFGNDQFAPILGYGDLIQGNIINDRKPSIKHLHIFGCICYITRDGENLDKMKEKGDPCVMVGYSTQSKGYRVYNKRTHLIVESIHIKFDEIKEMTSDHNRSELGIHDHSNEPVENVSLGLVPQGQKASDYDNSDPVPPRQNVVPTAREDRFVTSRTLVRSSSRNIANTDVHSFSTTSHDLPMDHVISIWKQVRGNPTMPVQTRQQLATYPEMCMFALTVSIVEPNNIKEAMADSAWIEAMQDELHQFDD
ncbi:retrovirus-related pol polyprotein from transposon TNT 1-94, partial [Tanacetum coccineum]